MKHVDVIILLFCIHRCESFVSITGPTTKKSGLFGKPQDRSARYAQIKDQIEVLDAESHLSTSTEMNKLGQVFNGIDEDGSGLIDLDELNSLLETMGLHATPEETEALFSALDKDGSGEVDFHEFQEWFEDEVSSARQRRTQVIEALVGRRTVNQFEVEPIPEAVVETAIHAATYAPNHRMTEPWKFRQLGAATVAAVAALNAAQISDPEKAAAKLKRWAAVPGWMVVTSERSQDEIIDTENYAATCCAIQNFCLALWAEGVGTKWTTGDVTRSKEFARICDIDLTVEKVVGVVWYGLAKGGLDSIKPRSRRPVADVHIKLP